LATLLTELDGVQAADGILVVGATNRPDAIDPALLRPGRLELHIEVPLPDAEGLVEILRIHTRKMPLHKSAQAPEFLSSLAEKLRGWSGALVENLCREAAMEALRQHVTALEACMGKQSNGEELNVTANHFLAALQRLQNQLQTDAVV
jgi:transitional endoplasmic reticulum ATPase